MDARGSHGSAGSRPGLSVGAGLVVGCLAGLVGVCLVGGAVVYWAGAQVGLLPGLSSAGGSGLGALAVWLLVLLLVVAGHSVASVWAWRTRPSRARVAVTQAPHAALYAGAAAWSFGTWTAGYLLWAYATLAAVAWLTAWFLHAPQIARRAVVYLCALGVVLAVNTAGILSVSWEKTNGFGRRGQTTPWAAFTALAATSCMAAHPFYDNGSNTIAADCPSGPDADFFAADYDETAFDNQLCDEQPRHAFEQWWEWSRQYQLQFELDWTPQHSIVDGREIPPPYPSEADGNRATIRYLMTVKRVSNVGADRPHQMRADTNEETWTVEFEPVALGGWKVCRIDIANPIAATFAPLDR